MSSANECIPEVRAHDDGQVAVRCNPGCALGDRLPWQIIELDGSPTWMPDSYVLGWRVLYLPPLPIGQVRKSPDGLTAMKTSPVTGSPWVIDGGDPSDMDDRLVDVDVADWEIVYDPAAVQS